MDFWGFIFGLFGAAIVLLIVDKLVAGISLGGLVNAMVAALAIAVVAAVADWLLVGVFGLAFSGWLGALVYLVVAAGVLVGAAKITPGFEVAGFGGAAIAAIAIGVVYWFFDWLAAFFA